MSSLLPPRLLLSSFGVFSASIAPKLLSAAIVASVNLPLLNGLESFANVCHKQIDNVQEFHMDILEQHGDQQRKIY